jgi:hypothetical protein
MFNCASMAASGSGDFFQMNRRLVALVILVLLFVVSAMIVGAILNPIPWDIRRYLGYVAIPVAVLWFLWSWFKWHAKQRGDQNELDVLEETVLEHEQGRHDNSEYIKKQISLSSATTSSLQKFSGF